MALTIPGVDFASTASEAEIETLARAGYKYVLRYVSGEYAASLAEKEAMWRHGMAIGLAYEGGQYDALNGAAAGEQHAEISRERAKALGLDGIPIYFTVDFDATGRTAQVAEYFEGAAKGLGRHRVGVYGGYAIVAYLAEHKICRWFWQTYAWSGSKVHPACHIYQHENEAKVDGFTVDKDLATDRGPFGVMGPHSRHGDDEHDEREREHERREREHERREREH